MERIVYVDVLLLTNFFISFFLIWTSGRFLKNKGAHQLLRYILASLLGAVYSLSVFLPPEYDILKAALRLPAAFCVCLAAYPASGLRAYLKNFLVLLAVTFAAGGALFALYFFGPLSRVEGFSIIDGVIYADIDLSAFLLVLCAGAFAVKLGFGAIAERSAERYSRVAVTLGGTTVELNALVDSGNILREPISGKSVLVAEKKSMEKFFPQHIDVLYPERIRLIPYKSVGGSGLMTGFRAESVKCGGKELDLIVGMYEGGLAADSSYDALLPADLI